MASVNKAMVNLYCFLISQVYFVSQTRRFHLTSTVQAELSANFMSLQHLNYSIFTTYWSLLIFQCKQSHSQMDLSQNMRVKSCSHWSQRCKIPQWLHCPVDFHPRLRGSWCTRPVYVGQQQKSSSPQSLATDCFMCRPHMLKHKP